MHSMRVVLKDLMRRNPAIFNPLWSFLYPLIYRRDEKCFGSEYLNGQQAFQMIFGENRWGSSESRSGRGSALTYTERLRPLLERYLKTLNVKVFLDAPCGDFNWMKYVTLPHGTGTSAGILSPRSSMICKKLWRYLGLWSREQVAAALGSSMPNRSI